MVICLGGVAGISFAKPPQKDATLEVSEKPEVEYNYTWGIFWAILSSVCYALNAVSSRKVKGVAVSVVLFYQCFTGASVAFVIVSIYCLSTGAPFF